MLKINLLEDKYMEQTKEPTLSQLISIYLVVKLNAQEKLEELQRLADEAECVVMSEEEHSVFWQVVKHIQREANSDPVERAEKTVNSLAGIQVFNTDAHDLIKALAVSFAIARKILLNMYEED